MRAILVLGLLVRIAHADDRACSHDKQLPVARGTIRVDGDLGDPV